MSKLMNQDEFRTALENAIKGRSANKAPFSIAWASGKLSREVRHHLGRSAVRPRRLVIDDSEKDLHSIALIH